MDRVTRHGRGGNQQLCWKACCSVRSPDRRGLRPSRVPEPSALEGRFRDAALALVNSARALRNLGGTDGRAVHNSYGLHCQPVSSFPKTAARIQVSRRPGCDLVAKRLAAGLECKRSLLMQRTPRGSLVQAAGASTARAQL